jgi:hypothetical protein
MSKKMRKRSSEHRQEPRELEESALRDVVGGLKLSSEDVNDHPPPLPVIDVFPPRRPPWAPPSYPGY